MLRERFLEDVKSIHQDVLVIHLAGGVRHIAPKWSIDDRDDVTVEYVEVHAISTGNYMRVTYERIERVTPLAPGSVRDGLDRRRFAEQMGVILAGATGGDHCTRIILRDGAIHLAPTYTVVYTGSERVTYGELHFVATLYMMSVPYDLVKGLVMYRPVQLVSG